MDMYAFLIFKENIEKEKYIDRVEKSNYCGFDESLKRCVKLQNNFSLSNLASRVYHYYSSYRNILFE